MPTDWSPVQYLRFADERSRPFVDLLAHVGAVDPAVVVDLGCGEGELTASLSRRWPRARVTGVDSSPAMLSAARVHAVPGRVSFVRGDLRTWEPDGPLDVLVSNAALQWVPEHRRRVVTWSAALAPGGWLGFQVPGNHAAPTHALLAALCRGPRWSDRVGDLAPSTAAVDDPAGYLDVLESSGLRAQAWETTYLHVLSGADAVLGWVRGSVLRPVLARLGDDAATFESAYAAALREAYPQRVDGTTLLPFRRVFAVGQAGTSR
ncbi:MAG: Trans-aconitate 2-methyltransferase [Klenkia sp.]|nr:Trans-aconitate 2-methyltransferase [Klenkia sp.]